MQPKPHAIVVIDEIARDAVRAAGIAFELRARTARGVDTENVRPRGVALIERDDNTCWIVCRHSENFSARARRRQRTRIAAGSVDSKEPLIALALRVLDIK